MPAAIAPDAITRRRPCRPHIQIHDEPRRAHARPSTARYARCIKASKRVRWDIDADVIRGRDFDFTQTFLPAGLSKVDDLAFLTGRRAPPAEPGAGPHLRLHLRPGRALHRRQGAGAVGPALARRPGRARGAGALQRRGTQAPGAVPPHRGDARRAHAAPAIAGSPTRTRWRAPCSARARGRCWR